MLGGRRPARLLSGAHLRESSLNVRSAFVGLLQAFLHGDGLGRLIRNVLREGELLSQRQADDAGQRQLLLRKIVARGNQLLPPALQFDLCPQHVDASRDAHRSHIHGLVVQRLRGLHLGIGRIHPRCGCNALQIGGPYNQHNGFARILITEPGRCGILPGGSFAGKQVEIDQRLREDSARVKISKWSHNQRKTRKLTDNFAKSLGGEIYLLRVLLHRGRQIRQERAARLNQLPLRRKLSVARKEQPQILPQPALDGIGKREGQGLRAHGAGGHAAERLVL